MHIAGRYDAGFRRANLVARDMIATRVSSDDVGEAGFDRRFNHDLWIKP
jgi:hypothetical protein